MEIADLQRALGAAAKTADKKTVVPIVGHVLVQSHGDELDIVGTDLERETTASIAGDFPPGEAFCLPATAFDAIAKKLKGETVDLALDAGGQQVTIRAGRSRFKLNCLPADDFPVFAAPLDPVRFALQPHQVAGLIGTVAFAQSSEETRYYLNGVFLTLEGDELVAVATDGHRLARAALAAPEGADGMPGVILPKDFVGEILRLAEAASSDELVSLEITTSRAAAHSGKTRVASKLIDGEFPDYRRVVPPESPTTLRIDRTEWSAAVDRMLTIGAESKLVRHELDDDVLRLGARGVAGEALEEVAAKWDGPAIAIGLNGSYVRAICGVLAGTELDVGIGAPDLPVRIRPHDAPVDGIDRLVVLMPMRA